MIPLHYSAIQGRRDLNPYYGSQSPVYWPIVRHPIIFEWKEKDSNLHRAGLQPAALPLELSFQKENHLSLSDKWFSNVQSIVTYLHIAQFKRSTISDKDITKSPVFVIKTNLNIPLYLLKLSHHSCRSHCFCSPLLTIFYSLSRLKTSDSNCASCSQGKRATITPRSQ